MIILPIIILISSSFITIIIIDQTLSRINSQEEKVEYINSILRNYTRWCYQGIRPYPDWCPYKIIGQSQDLFTWAVFGFSRCGGISQIAKSLLLQGGIESYIVKFPGEDHVFVDVSINNQFYVVDPGYYNKTVSLDKRLQDRIREFGNISYIILYVDDTRFIELTNEFPDTIKYDTIIIRVVKNNKSVTNACIKLFHKFQGRTTVIPDRNVCLYTNVYGEVTIHLGVPQYKKIAEIYEPYYWIYIDNINTSISVTSTGRNMTQYIIVPYPSR